MYASNSQSILTREDRCRCADPEYANEPLDSQSYDYAYDNIIVISPRPNANEPDFVTTTTGHDFVAKLPGTFTYDANGATLSSRRSIRRSGRPLHQTCNPFWRATGLRRRALGRRSAAADQPPLDLKYVLNLEPFNYDANSAILTSAHFTSSLINEYRMIYAQTPTNHITPLPRKTPAYTYAAVSLWNEKKAYSDATNSESLPSTPDSSYIYDTCLFVRKCGSPSALTSFHAYDAPNLAAPDSINASISASFGGTTSTSSAFYYGDRYYSPGPGRWPSRDPLQEEGGIHLYAFVLNNALCLIDAKGDTAKDVIKIYGAYRVAVNLMTSTGKRNVNPAYNNEMRSLYDLNLYDSAGARRGINYLACGEQVGNVIDYFYATIAAKLVSNWFFSFVRPAKFLGTHVQGIATSDCPSDPKITFDPWFDRITAK